MCEAHFCPNTCASCKEEDKIYEILKDHGIEAPCYLYNTFQSENNIRYEETLKELGITREEGRLPLLVTGGRYVSGYEEINSKISELLEDAVWESSIPNNSGEHSPEKRDSEELILEKSDAKLIQQAFQGSELLLFTTDSCKDCESVKSMTGKLQAGLNETAQEVDKHLEEAGNLCIYISNSGDLQEITYQEEQNKKQTSFYDMYLLSRNFPDYSGFNNAIQDIYIFFSEEDYIMKLPAVVPAEERSYQTLGSLSKDSYELICTQLESKYWEIIPFSLEQSNGNDRHLAIAQSFPHETYGMPD